MFVTRLCSGIVLVVIALATIITGGNILLSVLLLISLIGLREFYKAANIERDSIGALTIVGFLGVIAYYGMVFAKLQTYALEGLIVVMMAFLAVYVFSFPKHHGNEIFASFFGIVYVAVMLSYIYLTRVLPGGKITVWLIFLCSWGCDTCAYCVGVLIGKHKMAPVLSPKKSIEGAVGGVAGAALLGALYTFIMAKATGNAALYQKILPYAVVCIAGALISMIGDLAASAVKRNYGIKDYGHLIPGHGGILDRFDSVIFTAPMIYILCLLVG